MYVCTWGPNKSVGPVSRVEHSKIVWVRNTTLAIAHAMVGASGGTHEV